MVKSVYKKMIGNGGRPWSVRLRWKCLFLVSQGLHQALHLSNVFIANKIKEAHE